MNIALIGASGNVGSRLLQELSNRGHRVTAIARDPARIAALPGVAAVAGDADDVDALATQLRGHDAAISALRFDASDPRRLIDAVQRSAVPRYLVVGGAGSLEVAPGVALLDAPEFPPEYLEEARAGARFLELLRQEPTLDWTFLSPSALFLPGERTGSFRLGRDQLLADATGSRISYEDYAMAMVDEIERPAHRRQRFTAGY